MTKRVAFAEQADVDAAVASAKTTRWVDPSHRGVDLGFPRV